MLLPVLVLFLTVLLYHSYYYELNSKLILAIFIGSIAIVLILNVLAFFLILMFGDGFVPILYMRDEIYGYTYRRGQ